jgi:hypothetical protein
MRITHLRRRYFPQRFGAGGNGGALYAITVGPITVQALRDLVREERDQRIRQLDRVHVNDGEV